MEVVEMSKTIHDEGRREDGRRQQVRFRADETLVETFDDWVEGSDHSSRSEALRAAMRRELSDGASVRTPREPPHDDPLRMAYLTLCEICNADGVIRADFAENELSTRLGKRRETVNHSILGKLRDRGYLARVNNVYGDASWKLRGWDA